MKIIEQIIRFENHYKNAVEVSKKDLSDYFVYNTLAMECFQAVNSLIEIAEYIVSKNKLGFPSTYKELFEILHKNKFLDKKSWNDIKKLIFYRNLIAHEYYKISEKELKEMVKLLKSANKFVQNVKKKEDKL